MRAAILSVFALAFASGCATYTEGGVFGGFNDTPLARDTYRIQSYGNAYTTRQATNAIALVRAADLAAANGYDRFMILDYDEWVRSEYYTTPATITTNTDVSGYARTNTSASCTGRASAYGFGNSAFVNSYSSCDGNSRTHLTGNATSTTTVRPAERHEIEKPRTDMVVRFVSVGAPEADSALLVRDIVARFGKAAGLKPEQAQFIMQSVATGPPQYSAPTVAPISAVAPSVATVRAGAPQRRSANEVYASLSPNERAQVDALPFAERIAYLRSKQ